MGRREEDQAHAEAAERAWKARLDPMDADGEEDDYTGYSRTSDGLENNLDYDLDDD